MTMIPFLELNRRDDVGGRRQREHEVREREGV